MSSGGDFHGKIISLTGEVRFHSVQRKAGKGSKLYLPPFRRKKKNTHVMLFLFNTVI